MRIILAAVIVSAAAGAGAGDWPQFGGPGRNCVSPDKGLARAWPADGPKVLWTASVNPGFAGPAIAAGRAYILDLDGRKNVETLRCLDLADGKEVWALAYKPSGSARFQHFGSRSTPAVGERHVAAIGAYGDLHCVDIATGKSVWNVNIMTAYGARFPTYGVSTSPLLHKGLVIAAVQGTSAGVVALDLASGKEAWRSAPIGGEMAYSSPILSVIDGVEQVIVQSNDDTTDHRHEEEGGDINEQDVPAGNSPAAQARGAQNGAIAGFDVRDGKLLWSYGDWTCQHVISHPTPIGDGRFFVSGAYGAGAAMFKVQRANGQWSARTLWKSHELGSHMHQPVVHDGHIYVNSYTNERREGLVCLDLDGTVKWQSSPKDFDRGSMILADGLIYILDAYRGLLHLVQPDPGGYRELSSAEVVTGPAAWAPLALSDGKLLVRDRRQLKCLLVGKETPSTAPAGR